MLDCPEAFERCLELAPHKSWSPPGPARVARSHTTTLVFLKPCAMIAHFDSADRFSPPPCTMSRSLQSWSPPGPVRVVRIHATTSVGLLKRCATTASFVARMPTLVGGRRLEQISECLLDLKTVFKVLRCKWRWRSTITLE